MSDLLHHTADRAARYIAEINERRVFPSAEAIAGLEQFDEPLPDSPTDAEDAIRLLDEAGSPATVGTTSGRYFGFVTGGALPVTVAANWLATAWDEPASLYLSSPVGAIIEDIAMRWLLDVLKLPPESGVGFVTGATMANFSGLAAARHAILQGVGWDVESRGLFGAPPVTVIVGDEVHVSLLKGLSLLGFGRDRVIRVPVDSQGRMRGDQLPSIVGPTIVCVQAGNVNTGAFDPNGDICDIAHDAGAWVHVDGAFGLWAAAAPHRAHLVEGVEKADSWATDAHKWLNVPYDSGLVFCRNPEYLRAAMTVSAAYLIASERREPDSFTPELSRRARGVEIWAALRGLGRSGLAELIERNCRQATRFAEGLRAADYNVLNDVDLNQVLVSFGDAETTQKVIAAIQADGTLWCGGTVWQGHTAMRISVSSWATTDEDVERSLAAIVRIAGEVAG